MEVIYPRNTISDSQSAGTIGEAGGTVINEGNLNQTFNEWLTQYFTEDRSRTIIETINNYAGEMPDTGVNELIIAFMARFEDLLNQLINTNNQNTDKIIEKLAELHTVRDLGEFVWNDGNTTQHIYILEGGVPPTITINQYINNICGVAIFAAEFTSNDAATGLVPISLYPVDYIQELIANNPVITIGAENYVPITICDLTLNNNELGGQLIDDTETEEGTSIDAVTSEFGYYYNAYTVHHAKNIGSSEDWTIPTQQQFIDLMNYVGGAAIAGNKLKASGLNYWNTDLGLDEYGFKAVGSGYYAGSDFSALKQIGKLWTSTAKSEWFTYNVAFNHNDGSMSTTENSGLAVGMSIRLVKDANGVSDGTVIEYVGNNGIKYQAIAINELYWTPNLLETNWGDGSEMTFVNDQSTWAAMEDEAYANYDFSEVNQYTNGGIVILDNGSVSIGQIDSVNGLNEPKKVSELNKPVLGSLLLRKI
nr:FISUMP domain-containing protein [uncultured Draconibacterium sp.]